MASPTGVSAISTSESVGEVGSGAGMRPHRTRGSASGVSPAGGRGRTAMAVGRRSPAGGGHRLEPAAEAGVVGPDAVVGLAIGAWVVEALGEELGDVLHVHEVRQW